ncbi:hypothetical protein BKI52_15345 [marine bacterium AO1-C]|nr:hypothetical protein BKI52_15345 [marine bacterium AO1-C]
MHTHSHKSAEQNAQQPNNLIQKKEKPGSNEGQKPAIQAKHKPIQAKQRPIQAKQKTIQAKQKPIQRSTGGNDLKTTMSAQYGVDLSGFKEHQNSSFPDTIGAQATIQGKDIHYAPGQFTEQNRKHELGHAIDNTLNGTPKGDITVQGHHIDTSREAAADKIMNAPLQMKASSDSQQQATSEAASSIVQGKSAEVVQAKLRVGSKYYDRSSEGTFEAFDSYGKDPYKVQLKRLLEEEGTYDFKNWQEVKKYIDGNDALKDRGVIGNRTVKLPKELFILGEWHNGSPKAALERGINPSNLLYEKSMVKKEKGSGKGKLDHQLLQAMFIITKVGDEYQKQGSIEDETASVLNTLTSVSQVRNLQTLINQGADKNAILNLVAESFNALKGNMKIDAQNRTDHLGGGKMWQAMKDTNLHKNQGAATDSNFKTVGQDVNDVRDYFFANQIKANLKLPMIVLMGDFHVDGVLKHLKNAGVKVKGSNIFRDLPENAEKFAEKFGEVIDDDGSKNNLYNDMPASMKEPKPQVNNSQQKNKTINSPSIASFSLSGPKKNNKSKKKKQPKKTKKKNIAANNNANKAFKPHSTNPFASDWVDPSPNQSSDNPFDELFDDWND